MFLLMPWRLELGHMLMTMFKMLTSMRVDYLHRSTMTNTLAWNLKPRLTLPGASTPDRSVSANGTEAFRDAVDRL